MTGNTIDPRTAAELVADLRSDRATLAQITLHRRLHRLLTLDLTIQQLKMLLLVSSGEATAGAMLVERLGVTAPTVSNGVDRLVDLGLIARVENASDRRVRTLRATDDGARIARSVLSLEGDADEFLSELPHDDLAALVRGTAALLAAARHRSATAAAAADSSAR